MIKKENLLLYAITNSYDSIAAPLSEQVEQAILAGATMIQLREKKLSGKELVDEALAVQQICRKYHTPFIVNDNVNLALQINADGVHLGQCDMPLLEARQLLGPEKIIGITAKTVEQAKLAEANGADYLGSGAVFGTSTKPDAIPMSHDLLDQICDSVSIPVVAIGGIDKTNLSLLKGRKMCGVAIVGAIFNAPNIPEATAELRILAESACL
ncbi:MAG: thiamine phosphate synthase [Agathobacter sp.]